MLGSDDSTKRVSLIHSSEVHTGHILRTKEKGEERESSWHTGRRSAGVSVADHPGGLHTNRWATLGISLRATLNCLAFGALGL
jgi:hypothetical protein